MWYFKSQSKVDGTFYDAIKYEFEGYCGCKVEIESELLISIDSFFKSQFGIANRKIQSRGVANPEGLRNAETGVFVNTCFRK